jgi:hypothetical protein
MTANVLMLKIVVLDCGQKRLRLAHFQDSSGKLRGGFLPVKASPDPLRRGPIGLDAGKQSAERLRHQVLQQA